MPRGVTTRQRLVGVGDSLVLDCYEDGIVRNADVCKVGAENFILHYAALVGGFCTRIGATASQMVELGSGISWQPGPVTAKGRAIATVNIGGGLIFYGCADKLEDDKKKEKENEEGQRSEEEVEVRQESREVQGQRGRESKAPGLADGAANLASGGQAGCEDGRGASRESGRGASREEGRASRS